MKRAAVFLFMLLLAGCSDEKPMPSHATSEAIESPLQNSVISSFDTYPPKPVANADGDSISSPSSQSGCAGERLAEPARAAASHGGSLGAIP
jgi:PBP1b-binding outer membrane lipoprotein LpoB